MIILVAASSLSELSFRGLRWHVTMRSNMSVKRLANHAIPPFHHFVSTRRTLCSCRVVHVCFHQPIDKRQAWDAGLARKAPRDTLANNDGFLETLFRYAGPLAAWLFLVRVDLGASSSRHSTASTIEFCWRCLDNAPWASSCLSVPSFSCPVSS